MQEELLYLHADSCLATLYTIAFTSNEMYAGSDGVQTIQLQYNGSSMQNLTLHDRAGDDFLPNKGDVWESDLSHFGCITLSGIKRVSVVASSNDGWNIESIVTLVSESTSKFNQIQVLTRDFDIFRWVDGDSMESYRHFDLTLSTTNDINKGIILPSLIPIHSFASEKSEKGLGTRLNLAI